MVAITFSWVGVIISLVIFIIVMGVWIAERRGYFTSTDEQEATDQPDQVCAPVEVVTPVRSTKNQSQPRWYEAGNWLMEQLWEDEDVLFFTTLSASIFRVAIVITICSWTFLHASFETTAVHKEPLSSMMWTRPDMFLYVIFWAIGLPGIVFYLYRKERLRSIFAVTTHRMIIRRGYFLNVNVVMIPWNQVASIQVDQSWYDSSLGRGKLYVSDTGGQQWEFLEVDKVDEFRQAALDAITPRAT